MTRCSFVHRAPGGPHVAFVAERLRRYVQVVVIFDGVGSSPTECNTFFVFFVRPMLLSIELGGGVEPWTFFSVVEGQSTPLIYTWHSMPEKRAHTKSSLGKVSHAPSQQKKVMAVPGFEPGSSGSQPLMLTTTLYHQITSILGFVLHLFVEPWGD